MVIHLCIGMGSALYALNHVDPVLTILAYCKMRIYLMQSTAMMYRWCFVLACFDRFALSSTNARLRSFATVRVARRVVAIIISVWIVLPVHTLIFYILKGGNCGPLGSYAEALYHSLFTTITGCVLPILFMVSFTLLMYRNLVLKRQRRQQNIRETSARTNPTVDVQQKRDQQALMMLLIQVVVYTILTVPLMGFYFYSAISLGIPNKSPDRLAIEKFVQFVGETMADCFPFLSFYLYTLVSHTFRDELIKLLRPLIKKFKCLDDNTHVEVTKTTSTGGGNIGNQ